MNPLDPLWGRYTCRTAIEAGAGLRHEHLWVTGRPPVYTGVCLWCRTPIVKDHRICDQWLRFTIVEDTW